LTGQAPGERRSLRSLLPAIVPGQWLVFLLLVRSFMASGGVWLSSTITLTCHGLTDGYRRRATPF